LPYQPIIKDKKYAWSAGIVLDHEGAIPVPAEVNTEPDVPGLLLDTTVIDDGCVINTFTVPENVTALPELDEA
jgi:hypothetical protein